MLPASASISAPLSVGMLTPGVSAEAQVGAERSPSHQADDDTSAGKWWRRLAALLLLGPCHGERIRIAHVVPGGRDPAFGTLDMGDAELVDMAIEGIGDAAHVPPDEGQLS